jgi:hypothetical protein
MGAERQIRVQIRNRLEIQHHRRFDWGLLEPGSIRPVRNNVVQSMPRTVVGVGLGITQHQIG